MQNSLFFSLFFFFFAAFVQGLFGVNLYSSLVLNGFNGLFHTAVVFLFRSHTIVECVPDNQLNVLSLRGVVEMHYGTYCYVHL